MMIQSDFVRIEVGWKKNISWVYLLPGGSQEMTKQKYWKTGLSYFKWGKVESQTKSLMNDN